MAKDVIAVTEAARAAGQVANNLAGRVLALHKEAKRIDEAEVSRRARSLQLVSSKGGFSALIKAGKTTIQIEGDDFAVTSSD